MRTCAKRILGSVCLVLALFGALAFSPNAAAASFTWDASPDAATGKVIGYKFYYSTQAFTSLPTDVATNPAFTILTITNGTTSVDIANILAGQTYFMTVTALSTNNQESLPSNILTYTAGAPTGPTVAITSPAASVTVLSTDAVTVTANATSPVAITKVEFFDGASLLTTRTAAPYSFTTAFTAGAHVVTAKVTDANNATALSAAVTITSTAVAQNPANIPPTVAVTSPANNASFAANAVVNITASAADSDGTIAKVDFFDGATLIGSKTASPYTVTAPALTSGAHTITARATDNVGAVTTSAAITINVAANQAPTVAITSPANNTTFAINAQVSITATASDSDGTIAKVEFFDGATSLGSKTASPYTITSTTLTSGAHTITARATDNAGATTTSSAITVNISANQPPTVALTAPANSASFMTNDVVIISATASDTDGTISKVEFFDGATLLATSTSAPYTTSTTALAAGTHTITARATDNMGASTTSTASTITVNANQAPTVTLTSPIRDTIFLTTDTVTLTASASDADGTISKVQFFDGTTLLGTVTVAPYTVNASSLVAGAHNLTAVATDNKGGVTTSKAVPITVKANVLPTVALANVTEGGLLSQPVVLTANAADSDGTISSVEFFAGATSLGVITTAPYTITVPMNSGTYAFKAKAVDNNGGATFSVIVNASVKPTPPVNLTVK